MPSLSHRTRVTGEEIVDKTIMEIDIAADAVGSAELAPGAVAYANQITNDRIGSQHIQGTAVSYENQVKVNIIGYGRITTGLQGSIDTVAPDSVGTTQLKEPGVGSENLYSQAVYAAKIKDNAIGSQQIADNAIVRNKLIANVVGSQQMANSAIYADKIAANAVGYDKLTAGLQGSLGGMPDTIGTTQLKEPGVGSENIYNGAVYGTKIADNAVGYGKLTTGLQGSLGGMPDTIGTTQLKEPGVGSENIYNGAVYGTKIATGAVGSQKIATGAVYGAKIADHTIGSQHLITSGVIIQDTNQLADYLVDRGKLYYPYDFGVISNVTATGVYKEYTNPYAVAPAVVLTAIGTYVAVLDHTPDIGSFKAKLAVVGGGTANVHYIAIGQGTV